MANPTTNFGWVMPTSSSLVTNLPADFNTFGQAVDTSMAELKGGTTGQILSKTSATDMAFTWITNDVGDITAVTAGTGISGGGTSGAVTITNSMATEITAKGDLIAGTGSATFDNLPVGTNGQTLVADSSTATGLKWATPAASTPTFVGCSVYKSAAQSVANATSVTLTFDSEAFDTDAFHSTSVNNSRITIPSAKGGKYLVNSIVGFASNGSGIRSVLLYKNGSYINELVQGAPVSGSSTYFNTSYVVSLVATDYLEIVVYQDSGGSLNVNFGSNTTNFSVTYLGA